jgi:hypothetical protein
MHTLTDRANARRWNRWHDAWSQVVRGDFAQGARRHDALYSPAHLGTFATGQMKTVELARVEVNYDD